MAEKSPIESEKKLRALTPKQAAAEMLAADPLKDFFVEWLVDCAKAESALRRTLRTAQSERSFQRCLEKHPILLARLMGGGHGRWVIPHQFLGRDHEIDFIVGDKSSLGFEWLTVEIENPSHRLFTKSGDQSRALSHAIRQIMDWRTWLSRNIDYASRPRTESGLGLTDIDGEGAGLIIIGRRSQEREEDRSRRKALARKLSIQIHTWDWLLVGKDRVELPSDDPIVADRKQREYVRRLVTLDPHR